MPSPHPTAAYSRAALSDHSRVPAVRSQASVGAAHAVSPGAVTAVQGSSSLGGTVPHTQSTPLPWPPLTVRTDGPLGKITRAEDNCQSLLPAQSEPEVDASPWPRNVHPQRQVLSGALQGKLALDLATRVGQASPSCRALKAPTVLTGLP